MTRHTSTQAGMAGHDTNRQPKRLTEAGAWKTDRGRHPSFGTRTQRNSAIALFVHRPRIGDRRLRRQPPPPVRQDFRLDIEGQSSRPVDRPPDCASRGVAERQQGCTARLLPGFRQHRGSRRPRFRTRQGSYMFHRPFRIGELLPSPVEKQQPTRGYYSTMRRARVHTTDPDPSLAAIQTRKSGPPSTTLSTLQQRYRSERRASSSR